MSVIAFDSTEVRDYFLKEDVGEDKTVFKIGILDTPLRLYLNDKLSKYKISQGDGLAPAEVEYNVHAMNLEAVRFGLRGWSNFKDKTGQEVTYSVVSTAVPKVGNRDGLTDFLLKKFHPDWIYELGQEILRQNKLDKEAEKN
jgi:hypothetical protein